MNLFKTLPELSAEEKKNAKKHLFFAVRFCCAIRSAILKSTFRPQGCFRF